jgi:F0F1-type ATP synthase assembly protein I
LDKGTDRNRPRRKYEYFSGIKSGVISGLVWGGILSAVLYADLVINSASYISQLQQEQLPFTTTQTLNTTNSSTTIASSVTTYVTSYNITGGEPASQFFSQNFLSIFASYAVLYLIIGLVVGALIGLIFCVFVTRFLLNRPLPIRGIVLCSVFWLLFLASMLAGQSTDLLEIGSSLVASIIAGYVLGMLFDRFAGKKLMAAPPPGPESGTSSVTR